MRADQPRSLHWAPSNSCPRLETRLSFYPPGLRQAAHSHVKPHLSIVLAGSLIEEVGTQQAFISHGAMALRAEGSRHSILVGPGGMLILSMNVPDWPPGQFPRSGVSWLRPRKAAGHLLGLFSEGAIDEASAALLHGLPAAFPARQAPPWLEAAAERLAEGPAGLSISKLARHAGIHQAHFSRAFSRHFGLSPIMFRRRAMAAHALSTALSEGAGFADAAAAAGFTDQSHMSRAVVEACGLTPGRIRRLLQREAISIQSGKELVR